jgi:hypothetical protein
MDHLFMKKARRNQKEMARKLGMSRNMLNGYNKETKELGFPICYSRKRNTYFYLEDGYMLERLFKLGNEKKIAAAGD